MLILKREESDGEWTVLERNHRVRPLTAAIVAGGEYERGQRLEIAEEKHGPCDVPLAEWTPETGWTTTVYADVNGQDEGLWLSHLMVHEVSERLYLEISSFEPIAVELCYLLAALGKGTTVEWEQPEDPADASDVYEDIVKLCRHVFPEGHAIWQHVSFA